MCHRMFNIQEKSYDTVHISLFSHTGQAQMGPICTPDIGPLLSHGQQCSIVFYQMVSNQRFDVMFNFQHKSDNIVHISHFSHTGQAPMGPSFSPAIGPLLPHGPARPSRPAWDPRGAHLVLLAGKDESGIGLHYGAIHHKSIPQSKLPATLDNAKRSMIL